MQADLGEVALAQYVLGIERFYVFRSNPVGKRRLPDHAALQTYRVMAPMAYAKIKNIIERNVTSGLIYLPSSARDLNNPQIDQYTGEIRTRL